mmetsp:Transcript_45141/g.54700  ORF Transcript_45141/g.54700 Transcript_45141/m.54700 type:complete len:167 (+) Transcript_45141:265-765(+)
MIANPNLRALRYDPYSQTLSEEGYDMPKMLSMRRAAVEKARKAKVFGVILGTLGRQGNPALFANVRSKIRSKGKRCFCVLLSEVFPSKLEQMGNGSAVDAWVQVACPRLSVDWGHFFDKPLLNSFELEVCLGLADFPEDKYPMDYYKLGSGEWSNYHGGNKERECC